MSVATVVPGEGLNKTFVLGASLYDTISKLKDLNLPLKIAYAGKQYLQTPILVTLPHLGVRLMFQSSSKQQLLLVEVLNFDFLKLNYNGTYLNDIVYADPSDEELTAGDLAPRKHVLPPNLKLIYNKSFGPTFPGKLDLAAKTYILSYPGIAFKFHIELRDLAAKLADLSDDNGILSKLTNWDCASDIPCVALAIFKGEDYALFHRSLALPERVVAKSGPDFSLLSIEHLLVLLERGSAQFRFTAENKTEPATIFIGKSTQMDVLRVLGPPDGYFNKFDSRLLIHKHLKSASENIDSLAVYKFHNYFRHGLDFLYNLNSPHQGGGGVLEKIIIHNGGIAESLDFMQWNKCNWTVQTRVDGSPLVDSSMYFHEFGSEFLEEVDLLKVGPVLLNRNESEITNDDDLEIVQVSDIRNVNSSVELVNLKPSNEFKTWGQLKLYGYNRCIWEVIESNDCVSSVTIY